MEISIPEGVSTDEAGFPVLLFVVVCKFCACGSFSRALMWMKIKLKTSLVFRPGGRQTWWRWACPSSACRPQCLGQLVSPAPVIVTLQGAIQVTKSSCLLFCWFRIKRPGRLPVGWSPSCSALVPLHQSLLPPAWYMQNIALSHSKWIPWHCPWAVWRVWYWHPLQAVPAKSPLASPPEPGWESVQQMDLILRLHLFINDCGLAEAVEGAGDLPAQVGQHHLAGWPELCNVMFCLPNNLTKSIHHSIYGRDV